jgi:hypothetical protein
MAITVLYLYQSPESKSCVGKPETALVKQGNFYPGMKGPK